MKNFILLIVSVLTSFHVLFAQAYEGTVQYDKKKQQAIVADFAYPPEAVENAIIQKMEKLGFKPKEEKGLFNQDKGFLIFKNGYITDISNDRMDYLVKAERRSRKKDDESVIYIVMMKNDMNALNQLSAEDVGRAKAFLNNMIPDIEEANLELHIREQEEVLAKAEKKLAELRKDRDELEKKLNQNDTDQDNTVKDIDTQRQSLENLKSRRKNS